MEIIVAMAVLIFIIFINTMNKNNKVVINNHRLIANDKGTYTLEKYNQWLLAYEPIYYNVTHKEANNIISNLNRKIKNY